MKIRKGQDVVIAGTLILALLGASPTPVAAQSSPGGFPSVVKALRAAPGCLDERSSRAHEDRGEGSTATGAPFGDDRVGVQGP